MDGEKYMRAYDNSMPLACRKNNDDIELIRKGPWTEEEDSLLINYVNIHGERNWNAVARSAGLKRSGKSCRLRWLNYLRPDVRRGNITLYEQLLILQLHSLWGNRWSKIAKQLPGRTDNEIKNYWRTRVQKQAKQLNIEVNSQEFRDAMRHEWIPRLVEMINANTASSTPPAACFTSNNSTYVGNCTSHDVDAPNLMPEMMLSSGASPEYSLDTQMSGLTETTNDCYTLWDTYHDVNMIQNNSSPCWLNGGDSSLHDSLWTYQCDDNIWNV